MLIDPKTMREVFNKHEIDRWIKILCDLGPVMRGECVTALSVLVK